MINCCNSTFECSWCPSSNCNGSAHIPTSKQFINLQLLSYPSTVTVIGSTMPANISLYFEQFWYHPKSHQRCVSTESTLGATPLYLWVSPLYTFIIKNQKIISRAEHVIMNKCNKTCKWRGIAVFKKSIMLEFKLLHGFRILKHEIMLMACVFMFFLYIKNCKRFGMV